MHPPPLVSARFGGSKLLVALLAAGLPACADTRPPPAEESGHACAALETGEVACWGAGPLGQLGDGAGEERSGTPVLMLEVNDAAAVSVDKTHTCVLRASGVVSCAGNALDQLTASPPEGAIVVADVHELTDVVSISVYGGYIPQLCAVRATGEVVCTRPDPT